MSDLNVTERLRAADPAQTLPHDDPALRAALDELGAAIVADAPAPRRRRRRPSRAALAAAATLLAVAGTAAATGVVPVHTGIFGSAGKTENDTSEFLDLRSPNLRTVALRYGRDYPLPRGGSYAPAVRALQKTGGLMQTTGVRRFMAGAAACQWQAEWLAAHHASDSARARAAEDVLHAVPTWNVVKATDGGGVAALHRRIAAAAAQGNPGPIARDLRLNCGALLP